MLLFNSKLLGADKGVYIFDIRSKVNIIAWLEFELAYFETAVEHFSHYSSMRWQSRLILFEGYRFGESTVLGLHVFA